jgi:ATP-dependent DNA helicase RecQ
LITLGETDGVKAVYRGERCVTMRRITTGAEMAGRRGRARKRHGDEPLGVEAADAPLFEALGAWRRERAAEQRVPPYVIFHDATLMAIAITSSPRPGILGLTQQVVDDPAAPEPATRSREARRRVRGGRRRRYGNR